MLLWIFGFIFLVVKLVIVLAVLLLAAGWLVLAERKLLGRCICWRIPRGFPLEMLMIVMVGQGAARLQDLGVDKVSDKDSVRA